MKPLIGIIGRPEKNKEGNSMYGVYYNLASAITLLGGIPIGIIPPLAIDAYKKKTSEVECCSEEELESIFESLDICDGVILQGGDEFYDFDLKAIDYLKLKNKPLLGICLGMQTISVNAGASLYEIKDKTHKSKDDYVHEIYISKDSLLYKILNKNRLRVNSKHYSGVLNPTLKISAISEDGIIECVEDITKKFFVGVLWHPETMISYDEDQKKILKYFIDICKKN